MRILGIDPGTATVGWGIVEIGMGGMQTIAYGHISTSPKHPLPKRLVEIARDLESIVKIHQPDEASVEELFFFKNQKTAVSVAEARGAILLTLETLRVKLFEYTPLQVKQSLTGYGRAEKRQMQIMVKSILQLASIPKPDDTADALALALCHANSRTMIERTLIS